MDGRKRIEMMKAKNTPIAVKIPNSLTILMFTNDNAPNPTAVVTLVSINAVPIFFIV